VPASPEWWRSRIHPDDLPDTLFRYQAALDSKPSYDVEYRMLHRRGDYVHVWDRGRVLRDRLGRAVRLVGCMVNVTERKRAEAALRESEERHRLLSELTSDYTYTCRVEPDGSIQLDSATAGFTRVTGYTLEEAEARGGWASFIHPADLPGARQRMAPLLSGVPGVDELRIVTKHGQTRWIRYSIYPVWDAARKRVVRFLGAVQDITERKQAEAQLQGAAQRLQALSRRLLEVQELERRHLARELHDEVGQALTGLKFALEMSTQLRGDRLSVAQDEAQAVVRDLTARVRDLSLRLRPTMLDDLGLLPALVWLFQRCSAQLNIEVDFRHSGLGGRFPPEVETAAYRIIQEALTNVARHAGVRVATVRVWLDRGSLHLQVEDHGSGFDPATIHHAGPSSGLSGMQERAVLLGGRLTIESDSGSGTCLTAELPVHSPGERPTDDTEPAAGR
jgi:PAS domain S-box-containing protein